MHSFSAQDYLRSDLRISFLLCGDLSGCCVIQSLLSGEKIMQGKGATEQHIEDRRIV